MRTSFARAFCTASALALCVPAPALAASTDYYLKIKGIEGDSGKAQADKHKNQIEILSYSWGETRQADALTDGLLILRNSDEPAGSAGKVSKVESIAIKQGTVAAPAPAGGVSVAAGDVTGDGRGASAAPKSGSLPYLNRTRQKELSAPAAAGSLTVTVAPGHGLCTAGKPLGTLTLAGSGGRTYVLKGVAVAGCAAGPAGDQPTESVSLNYTKIEF